MINQKNRREDILSQLFGADILEVTDQGISIDDLFYLEDLKKRKQFLFCTIDPSTVSGLIRNIMKFNAEDAGKPMEERTPILLYIFSRGGDQEACFALIDAITVSKTPVYTVNIGCACSAGFLVFLAGHKRFSMPNATFLLHDGEMGVMNSIAKTHDYMAFSRETEEMIRSYILEHSTVSPEEYDRRYRTEWYMLPKAAKENGFVDCIIGEDCPLDEIL